MKIIKLQDVQNWLLLCQDVCCFNHRILFLPRRGRRAGSLGVTWIEPWWALHQLGCQLGFLWNTNWFNRNTNPTFKNGDFHKYGCLQITHWYKIFPYKPISYWGAMSGKLHVYKQTSIQRDCSHWDCINLCGEKSEQQIHHQLVQDFHSISDILRDKWGYRGNKDM